MVRIRLWEWLTLAFVAACVSIVLWWSLTPEWR
jgi:hypothetical protein